jgi:arylsulfatase A-like enzyme
MRGHRTGGLLAAIGLIVACQSILATPLAQARPRPNVVILMSDDQRWDKVTPYYTPNIWDLLIDSPATYLHPKATSTYFENAFAPNPLCCPSRTSTLTGNHSHTTGVWTNSGQHGGFAAFDDTSTIAVDFQQAGYRTAMIGKYLNGYVGGRDTYVPPGWDRWFATNTGAFYNYGVTSGMATLRYGKRPERDYIVNVLTDKATSFVQKAQADGKPFFLFYSFTGPHGKAIPDPDDVGRFAGETDFTFPQAKNSSMLDSAYSIDVAVRFLMDVLPPNTIVVYMSDNGYLWGEHGLSGKRYPYEESLRIPMVIASLDGSYRPAADPADLVLNIDLRPTLTAAAGIAMTGSVEGVDLGNGSYVPRTHFVIEHGSTNLNYCGVRTSDWKYARYKDGTELLFHLSADPQEQVNLLPIDPADADLLAEYEQLKADAMAMCLPTPPGYSW